jgi:hypothetical protein
MQVYGAKQALQAVCGRTYAFGYEAGKTGVADAVDGWDRALGLLNELSPTCTLVALAHAMRTREFLPDPKAMGRLGAALDDGLRFADAMWRTDSNPLTQDPAYLQAIDGLDYLMHELPADLRPQASAMLLPLLPRLADHLAEAQPYRPDAVAALIVRGGSLPDKVRVQLTAIAKGRTTGAPQARAVLASLSGKAG